MKKLTDLLIELKQEEFEKEDESNMSDKHIKFREAIRRDNAKMKDTLDMLRSNTNAAAKEAIVAIDNLGKLMKEKGYIF